MCLTMIVTALLFTVNATPLAGRWLYGSWIVLLIGITPGTYVLLPKAVASYFGPRNVAFNYSLLFTNFVNTFCIYKINELLRIDFVFGFISWLVDHFLPWSRTFSLINLAGSASFGLPRCLARQVFQLQDLYRHILWQFKIILFATTAGVITYLLPTNYWSSMSIFYSVTVYGNMDIKFLVYNVPWILFYAYLYYF